MGRKKKSLVEQAKKHAVGLMDANPALKDSQIAKHVGVVPLTVGKWRFEFEKRKKMEDYVCKQIERKNIEKLAKDNQRLRKALKFYADGKHYVTDVRSEEEADCVEFGELAKKTLKKMEDGGIND